MTDTPKIKITLDGAGLDKNHIWEVDSSKIPAILAILYETETGVSPSSSISLSAPKKILSQKSIVEFLNDKKVKTNPQKIAVFALYMRDHLDHKFVSLNDFKSMFEQAREMMPKNLSRDLNSSIGAGWISESFNEPGKYFITVTGEEAIEKNFKGTRVSTRKRSRSNLFVQTNIREDIKNLNINSVSEKYGNYWKLAKKGDKVLWLLAESLSKGMKQLNLKEISELSKKVGDHIPSGSITALTENHVREGRITPQSVNSIKILDVLKPGEDYLLSKLSSEE